MLCSTGGAEGRIQEPRVWTSEDQADQASPSVAVGPEVVQRVLGSALVGEAEPPLTNAT